jgi:hypothetical protein
VAYALFIVARQLWAAAVHLLTAFVRFLGTLVTTLPAILIAGVVALAGLWVMNNLKLSSLPSFTLFERGTTGPSSDSEKQSPQATERARPETAGSRQ